jgi:LysR family transcriptional regulator, glycine cleavage system transcriptional activator
MRLPLNTLPAFRAVAELQNLRAAADRLHLTHSAVSQQIKGLEEQLGFPLFERSGRGIVLNPAGAALLCSVQSAMALLDEGLMAASAAARGSAQRLRVSVLPSFAQRWLLPRMARWQSRPRNKWWTCCGTAFMRPCGLAVAPGPAWSRNRCSICPCR